ncbi:ligand-binding sensor domain-containing protein [Parafilimonas sp.]|uniref:ligand-binding sensor domain-containing protein n=1 Tax=Parafilimonas sp. TaxID=1969739 RepID=UPI003F7EAB20
MRKCFAFIVLLFFLADARTQPYYFTHYQVEDGLSNNAVLCVMQDHLGFMWFGTRDGLNRFDGLSYKIFRNNPSDKKSIGSNAIMSLSETANKKIWVGTEKGLFVFDELTESFTKFEPAGNGSVQSVKVVGDDVYYITLYALYRHNTKTNVTNAFSINKEVTAYNILKDGSLWVTTSSGTIAKYNTANNSFDEKYDLFSHSGYVVSKWIQSLYDAGNGTLLIGTSNQGLKLFDIKTSTYKDLLTSNTDKTDIIVRDIIAINKDEYWIATQSGIYIFNISNGNYYNLQKQIEDPYSLSDNIVQTLCLDKQGGIWAGTYFGGVNYYPKQDIIFKKYFPKVNENSISGNAVSEIYEDDHGMLWVGTEDAGLNKFNAATGNFINYNPAKDRQTVSYSNIHSLLAYNDTVWAGTYLHGLDLLNSDGKRLHNFNTLNADIGSNFIGALLKTKTGEIIAATDKGAFKYLPSTNNFERITALPKAFFRALGEDNNGNIWGGTYGDGIYIYNPSTNKAEHYFFSINHNQVIACNIVNYIYYDSKNTVWFATEGGLCAYKPEKKELHIYTSRDGLPADVVYAILEDNHHNLWVSTSKGLVRFTPSTKEVKIFNKSHGLLTDQFNYRSACKDEKGNMYFGSVKGMISFNPDSITSNDFIPPVYITGFQVYNKELCIDSTKSPLKQSITFTKKIVLAHNQSSFSIDFAALNYNAPSTIGYAYKMEGLDKSWTYLTTNRKAYFTELTPGNYTFLVRVLDAKNTADNYAKLDIEILPPFWRTWQAYMLYAVLILLIIFFTIKFFIDRSRARQQRRLEKLAYEKEKENYEDKINFFTNVAHEIKTPLTLIKGPMENIMDQIDEVPSIKTSVELMSRNTDRLMHLANQLLDFRKIEMNGFHLSFIKTNVSRLLYDNYIRFKPVADQKNIRLDVKSVENLSAYADEEALNKIFSNLIDNAVKYAEKFVSISLHYTDDKKERYQLVCSNDGFIIPEENKEVIFDSFYRLKETSNHAGTGIGLTLSRSLAEMHNGTLVLDKCIKDLNVFVLTLPVHPISNIHNSD